MTKDSFRALIDARLAAIVQTLQSKGEEYQKGEKDDVLHNFKRAAHIANHTKEQALDGMMMKHYISYRDILEDVSKGNLPTEEILDEKIGDLINYLILMEACIKESIHKQKEVVETE